MYNIFSARNSFFSFFFNTSTKLNKSSLVKLTQGITTIILLTLTQLDNA